jgi:TrmH family RNA methyltransferase
VSDPLARTSPALQRLRRLSRRRDALADERALLIDGPVLLDEALRSDVRITAVFADEDLDPTTGVLRRARAAGVEVATVRSGELARVLDLVTPRGVVAVVEQPTHRLTGVLAESVQQRRPVVVAVELQDPGNAGTLVRVAEAAGAVGVVLTTGSVDPWNPKAVRAAAGASLRLPVVAGVSVDEVVHGLASLGVRLLATSAAGASFPEDSDLGGSFALCIGNEAHGLDQGLLDSADGLVAIPMAGGVESLNAGVAAAVILFDAARQRRSAQHSDVVRGRVGPVGHDVADVADDDEARVGDDGA